MYFLVFDSNEFYFSFLGPTSMLSLNHYGLCIHGYDWLSNVWC